MKSLHLTNYYHPSSGGVRTFYHSLLDTANRLRRETRLVVPGDTDSIQEYGDSCRIYTIAAPRAPFDSSYRLLYPYEFLPPFQGHIRKILQDERPDVIVIGDKYTLCYLAGIVRKGWLDGLGRPLLLGESNERMDDGLSAAFGDHSMSRWFARWYMRSIYLPQFDYHLANSSYTAQECSENLEDHRKNRFRVVPPGVEIDAFGPQFRNSQLRDELAGSTAMLLYVGRLSPEKNLPLALDAVEQLGDSVTLVVAGDGPLRSWLDSEAEKRKLPLRAIGHVASRAKLASLYASADALIHPNPREPFGIAPLEAMASGCPVILPRSGGVLTYATEQNSWLCQPNAADFAAAARHILADSAERQRRIGAAIETARRYSCDRATEAYFALLDELRNEEQYAA